MADEDRLTPDARAAIDAARLRASGVKPALVQDTTPKPEPDVQPDEPSGFYGSSIGGFNLEQGELKWGPFASPDDAAKWAIDNLPAGGNWIIRPILDPTSET